MKKDATSLRRPVRPSGPAEGAAPSQELAQMQQRLVEAQRTIERDYTRLRELEARHRYLFEGRGPMAVVDASLAVLDANAAACTVFGRPLARLAGTPLADVLDPRSAAALESLAGSVLRGVPAPPAHVATADGTRLLATATLFRQDGATVLLLALRDEDSKPRRGRDADAAAIDAGVEGWGRYAAAAADGLVLTDLAGRVQHANAAFVEMVQLASERQLVGESLGRWLGRTSVDLGVLVTNLRQRGTLRLFATQLRAEYGSLTEVEIAAALVAGNARPQLLGFTVRDVGRRLAGETRARDDIPQSVGQLTELVGRVPMKEIVGNTAGLIEKMCIEAALQLTRDNRAAAAELLGLSRQSLYVKLRRYGIGDVDLEETAAG